MSAITTLPIGSNFLNDNSNQNILNNIKKIIDGEQLYSHYGRVLWTNSMYLRIPNELEPSRIHAKLDKITRTILYSLESETQACFQVVHLSGYFYSSTAKKKYSCFSDYSINEKICIFWSKATEQYDIPIHIHGLDYNDYEHLISSTSFGHSEDCWFEERYKDLLNIIDNMKKHETDKLKDLVIDISSRYDLCTRKGAKNTENCASTIRSKIIKIREKYKQATVRVRITNIAYCNYSGLRKPTTEKQKYPIYAQFSQSNEYNADLAEKIKKLPDTLVDDKDLSLWGWSAWKKPYNEEINREALKKHKEIPIRFRSYDIPYFSALAAQSQIDTSFDILEIHVRNFLGRGNRSLEGKDLHTWDWCCQKANNHDVIRELLSKIVCEKVSLNFFYPTFENPNQSMLGFKFEDSEAKAKLGDLNGMISYAQYLLDYKEFDQAGDLVKYIDKMHERKHKTVEQNNWLSSIRDSILKIKANRNTKKKRPNVKSRDNKQKSEKFKLDSSNLTPVSKSCSEKSSKVPSRCTRSLKK